MNDESLIGKRFGRLKVVAFLGIKNRKRYWMCKCDCGNEKEVYTAYLNNGKTRSCGCLLAEIRKVSGTKHGMANTKTYSSWSCMIQRCTNPKHKGYKRYGGRGIKVCDAWLDFNEFYKDMGERPAGCTLDRIDVNGNYEKENCRWADNKTQHGNKTNSFKITYNVETHTLSEWARILGIPRNTLNNRLKRGKWSIEEAFEKKGA